ncbi:MAG: DNA internalization-related competence protein ComEC/Rec2 [Actinomycetota bacterium]
MTGWLLPVAAGCVWAGMLVGTSLARLAGPSWLLAAAATLLAGSVLSAARAPADADPLQEAGLEPPTSAVVTGATRPRRRSGRGPPGLTVILILTGCTLLGAGWGSFRSEALSTSLLSGMAPAQVTIVGALRSDPEVGRYGWSAVLSTSSVRSSDAAFRVRQQVWVQAEGGLPIAHRGDVVEVSGGLEIPGEGFGEYLRSRGIAVSLSADTFRRIGPSANPFVRFADAVRTSLRTSMHELFSSKDAGLLLGLALGDTSELQSGTQRDFQATGLTHLLAVSGGNVAMVLVPIMALALALRLAPSVRIGLCIATVVFFVILTGGEPSVLRAGVMAVLVLSGGWLGRRGSSWPILGASVLVLLLLDPFLARSVGFQLSVGATAGIVTFSAALASRMRWLPRPVAAAVATTVSAQIGVAPLLLAYFHWVPVVSILANVIAFPLVEPAMLIGLAAAMLHPVAPALAAPIATLDRALLHVLQGIADLMATAPMPSVTSGGGWRPLVIGTGIILGAVWWLRPRDPRSRVPRVPALAAVILLPLVAWATALRAGPPERLTVRFFDVEQGDSALVTAPDGGTILIDGGPEPDVVAVKLAALGVRRLDAVVASHPHADHVEGLPQVFARFPVGLVLEPGCADESPSYAQFLEAIRDEELPVRHPRTGETISVGGMRLEVLSPDACYEGTESDANNDFLVVRVTYEQDTVLFPGDAEVDAQEELMADGAPLAAPVLKVPHHGGDTSADGFFAAVSPQVSIVSVGQPNGYGHPVPEVMSALEAAGSRVVRTDQGGDVVVTFIPEGIAVGYAA